MRLLFVSHSFPPEDRPLSNVGGMQRIATEAHEALLKRSDVRLTSRLLRTEWRWTPYRLVPFMTELLWEIPRIVARESVDAVLFSSMVTAFLAPILRKQLGAACPTLAVIPVGRDVTLPSAPYQHIVPHIFDALDLALPISRATGNECLARGLAPEKMRVVPCGVDTSRFVPTENRERARRELLAALPTSISPSLLLCSVGRHQERKGFHWFVAEVMPHLPPDIHYLVAGEGPMTGAIEEAMTRHELSGRVHPLGKVSEGMLQTLYRGADLFVMPNIPVPGDMEGFGVVMLEAGLAGLPVVAARLEGIQDVVTEGENGHLVESGDAGGFARTILSYHHAPERLKDASKRATHYISTGYSWDTIVERYLQALSATTPARASQNERAGTAL